MLKFNGRRWNFYITYAKLLLQYNKHITTKIKVSWATFKRIYKVLAHADLTSNQYNFRLFSLNALYCSIFNSEKVKSSFSRMRIFGGVHDVKSELKADEAISSKVMVFVLSL